MSGKKGDKGNFKLQFSRRRARANAGYHDQEYCQKQDEGPFEDENVEEHAVKFSRFHGHVHRTNSLNFFRVELRSGSVQFPDCYESWQ